MTEDKTILAEDKERFDWACKNIPVQDLFTYFYSGSSNKSLEEFREYIDAKRSPYK